MKIEFIANKRELQGTGASRRLRRAGRVPAIVYGGTEAAQAIELKVGGNSIVINTQGVTVKGTMITIEASGKLDVKGAMSTVAGSGMLTLQGGMVKVNPLANWNSRDTYRYMVAHDIPMHPLFEQGYPSIGCFPCTRPVLAGEDERSGRWAGRNKTECGLHL